MRLFGARVVPLFPRTRTAPAGRSSAPRTLRVDPLALAVATRLAGGDRSRLEVLDARTVLVRNRSRQGRP